MQIGGLRCLKEGREENREREKSIPYGFLEVRLQVGISRIIAEKHKNGVCAQVVSVEEWL